MAARAAERAEPGIVASPDPAEPETPADPLADLDHAVRTAHQSLQRSLEAAVTVLADAAADRAAVKATLDRVERLRTVCDHILLQARGAGTGQPAAARAA